MVELTSLRLKSEIVEVGVDEDTLPKLPDKSRLRLFNDWCMYVVDVFTPTRVSLMVSWCGYHHYN